MASPTVEKTQQNLLAELQKSPSLKHSPSISDRSSPIIEADVKLRKFDKHELLSSIEQGVGLKHVEEVRDHSSPVIEEVTVKRVDRSGLLNELRSVGSHKALVNEAKAVFEGEGSLPLQHVEDVKDRSAPIIEPGVTLRTWDKQGLLNEIVNPPPLQPTNSVDRSAPVIREPEQMVA